MIHPFSPPINTNYFRQKRRSRICPSFLSRSSCKVPHSGLRLLKPRANSVAPLAMRAVLHSVVAAYGWRNECTYSKRRWHLSHPQQQQQPDPSGVHPSPLYSTSEATRAQGMLSFKRYVLLIEGCVLESTGWSIFQAAAHARAMQSIHSVYHSASRIHTVVP